jgi:uncharacterized protein (DUF1330 family)
MKAYWIARVHVKNPEAYKDYVEKSGPAISAHQGTFLARGGPQTIMEGGTQLNRSVIIEFPSLEQAQKCYQSDAYQQAKSLRQDAAEFHCVIVEGAM